MTIWLWLGFVVFVVGMLSLDLGVFHRRAHVVQMREAVAWTVFWVATSLAFNVAVYFLYEHDWLGIGTSVGHALNGRAAALQFFTGYVIEKSLSLDNIFVIALIFNYFRVPAIHQHRILYWGILGALVMRGAMILAGVALIRRFEWIIYVFGLLLIFAAIKMLLARQWEFNPATNPLIRLAKRLYPLRDDYTGPKFFTRLNGDRAITPLFLALLIVESTDLLFAIDSIPAVFAVTRDPFIVFTSNVFAILGLRSLYFALAGMMERFRHIKTSLVCVLAFVGVKMLLSHHYPIPTPVSLAVILGIVSAGVVFSVARGARDGAAMAPVTGDLVDLAEVAYHKAKRVVMIVVGLTLLLVGLAMVVLPGPAAVVIPIALSILGGEFVWARKLLRNAKEGVRRAAELVGLDEHLPTFLDVDEPPRSTSTGDAK